MNDKRHLIIDEKIHSPVAEAYRVLRTNLQFVKTGGNLKTIMITSAGVEEGKSTTAANLALVLSQSGKQVILMDCDLRKPVQHKIFGKKNSGITNFLVGGFECKGLLQATDFPGVTLFASGPIPPNPAELLCSKRIPELINWLQSQSDFLIIDAPPVIAVNDACVLASLVDGVLLVICAGKVKPKTAKRAKELIIKANGTLLGVVLNRAEIEENHDFYYYYGNKENSTGK